MRTKMRPRYYCDHCNKSGGSASHMKKHERGCTLNPQRICGFCGAPTDFAALIPTLRPHDADSLKRLGALADECPGCMLAAIRQSDDESQSYLDSDGWTVGFSFGFGFDFKTKAQEWWANVNDDEMERRGY